jgi:sporulation protein YlmC with PRC-barrel domain
MAWEMTETADVIGSDKVQGTNVYSTDGEKMGSIERLMIEKTSGKVSYAVLSFGGILGVGHEHYPVPWRTLSYDKTVEGYRTTLPKEKLLEAPKHAPDGHWTWEDPQGVRAIEDYWKEHSFRIAEARL